MKTSGISHAPKLHGMSVRVAGKALKNGDQASLVLRSR